MNFMPPYERNRDVDPEMGYIFGEFIVQGFSGNRMYAGLKVTGGECFSSEGCVFKFVNEPAAVYPVAVEPGEYRLEGIVLSAGGAPKEIPFSIELRRKFPQLSQPIRVQAGRVTYVGSFVASARTEYSPGYYYNYIHMADIYFDMEKAGMRLMYRYPEFNGLVFLSDSNLQGIQK
jgi:hypothetical protein